MPLEFSDPKLSQVYEGGAAVEDANVAVIFLHGKGGNAEVMFERAASAAEGTDDVVYFAPKSVNGNWFWGEYTSADDPNLIASINAITSMLSTINAAGIPNENIVLVGYSQGAVLANEYIAQTGTQFKEVLAFSGSLVTPVGEVAGTPAIEKYSNADPLGDLVFDPLPGEFDDADLTGQIITLTVHENDPRAPLALARATADYYRSKGAQVELHVERGQSHAYTNYDSKQLSDAMKFNVNAELLVQTTLNNGGYVTAVEKVSRYDETDSRITLKVFNEYGFTRTSQEIEVDTATGTFMSPALATLTDGNFVLVYADDSSDKLIGNVYSQNGAVVQANIVLAQHIDPDHRAVITVDSDGFDVQYREDDGDLGSYSYVLTPGDGEIPPISTEPLPMNGDGGANLLSGDAGDNTMYGYNGNDVMSGQAGKDKMYGGNHNDTMYGNDGNDLVKGQSGNDFLYGNNGNDTLMGEAGDDVLFGDDAKESSLPGAAHGADLLRGGIGNDTLYGGSENDTLKGEDGNDHLFGGSGKNILSGGAGNDVFHFLGESSNNTINDFNTGIDSIFIESILVDDIGDVSITLLSNGSTRLEFDETSVIIKGTFDDGDIYIV